MCSPITFILCLVVPPTLTMRSYFNKVCTCPKPKVEQDRPNLVPFYCFLESFSLPRNSLRMTADGRKKHARPRGRIGSSPSSMRPNACVFFRRGIYAFQASIMLSLVKMIRLFRICFGSAATRKQDAYSRYLYSQSCIVRLSKAHCGVKRLSSTSIRQSANEQPNTSMVRVLLPASPYLHYPTSSISVPHCPSTSCSTCANFLRPTPFHPRPLKY